MKKQQSGAVTLHRITRNCRSISTLLTSGFLCWTLFANSQDYKKMDSLTRAMDLAPNDTAKVWAMHNLAFNYIYSKPDSTIWLAQKALDLSKKIDFERGEIRALNDIGNALSATGNYSEATETLLKALHQSEMLKDKRMEAITLGNLAENYSLQGDQRQAIAFVNRSLAINRVTHDLPFTVFYVNLGNYYERAGRLDSALSYQNQAYELAVTKQEKEVLGEIVYSLGNIQSLIGNDDLALPYYRKAVVLNQLVGNDTYLGLTYYELARLFQRAGATDSTLFYLKQSYETSMRLSDRKGMLDAASGLASLYERDNNDSTLKYLKLSVALKDSLFNQEKVKQVQILTINEQLREARIAAMLNEQKAERRNNLQLMAIAAFIPLFFGIILLLSRKRSKPRTIEFLGLLGLLFLFEFISLLIHPYIASYTHHTPVFMLLILVGVAALLVPSHHKLQKLVVDKLARKPQKKAAPVMEPSQVPEEG